MELVAFMNMSFDVFKFIAYELFLYYVAILLKYEKIYRFG